MGTAAATAGAAVLQHLSSERQRRADVSDVFIVAWVGKLIADDYRFTVHTSLKGRYETAQSPNGLKKMTVKNVTFYHDAHI